ncbi:MAG: sugar ABC transporter permease [Streptosporangiaceae bacterium]|nr:sugar ABC transporter permease [Streptosporangiaceae bacterium]
MTQETIETVTRERWARLGTAGSTRSKKRRTGIVRRPKTGMLFVAPAFIFVAVFVLFPLGFAVYMSLTNWPLIGSYHFNGVHNYAALGKDPGFIHSVLFTLLYTGIVTIPILVLGYGLAVLVRSNRRGSVFLRTAFFLPYVIGLPTLSYIVLLELQPNSGAVNWVLAKLHITNGATAWLVNTNLALAATCILVIWFASGLTMVLLLGAMQSISDDLYESAAVLGAKWWERERYVTLPLVRPTIALSLIISIIGSFLAFNQFFILTQGGPGTSTFTVVMWIYQTAFVQLHVGAAAAMSVVLVAVVGLISFVQFLLLRSNT